MARIDAVGVAEVRALATRLFSSVTPAMAAVGDVNGLAPFDTIAAKFS